MPLSVRFHTGKTGTELHQRFGRDGLLVWVCYLAACKVHDPPGRISYASDTEGWALLGLAHDPPDFSLDDFFTVTGRLKKTRRRRSGRVTETICTVWTRWTHASEQEAARERKARSRGQNNRDIDRDNDVTSPGHHRDLDLEGEEDLDTPPTPPPSGGNPRANGTNPRAKAEAKRAAQDEAKRHANLVAYIRRCIAEEWSDWSLTHELTNERGLTQEEAAELIAEAKTATEVAAA